MARQYKLARKMKKITLTAAARELGISQPSLSAWESERSSPSVDALIRMSKYYGVTVDFLLGLTTESDPRPDLLRRISGETLPAMHETPVYVPGSGWAFVDAVERQLHFANGAILPFADAKELYYLPPAFETAVFSHTKPLEKSEITEYEEIWVEPISTDTDLRAELRGWYHVKKRCVENEAGQRFYLDFYGSKWLGFRNKHDSDL